MAETFGEGQLQEYVDWLDRHPAGYVWNASKSMLHRVRCPTIQRFAYRPRPSDKPRKKVGASKRAVKVCAPTKKEVFSEVPEAKAVRGRCSVCNP